ncbi:MAG: hypothetical protein WBH44_09040 [Proteocatella sp.]
MRKRTEYTTYYDEEGRLHTASTRVRDTAKAGISFGSGLAMVISYVTWQSIPWAIFHGILGWVYVIYFWIKY